MITVVLGKAGQVTETVKLTKAGRRLLESDKQQKLTEKDSFTPTGGSETTVTKTVVLKR